MGSCLECVSIDKDSIGKGSSKIPNYTGISTSYEELAQPEIIVNTGGKTIEEASAYIFEKIQKYLQG